MHIRNFEFKARVDDVEKFENKLLQLNPVFKGIDHQMDTCFNVPKERLKLREGNIENALINYAREDVADIKQSNVILYQHKPDVALKNILSFQFGIRVVVDKIRKIYFIDNVKFHFDTVKDLGTFIEVEAIDNEEQFSAEKLKEQCDKYFSFFELEKSALVEKSYSDLMEENKPR